MIERCLFPVAGYGTRFLPATKSMPKEMLPIVNKPLVQYGVEEATEAGIHTFGFVTGRGKRAIADHFDVSYELESEIQGSNKEKLLASIKDLIAVNKFAFTRQNYMKGLGHAILSGEILMGEQPFAVILSDDLCIAEEGDECVLAQMVKIYKRYQCNIVAIQEVLPDKTDHYGIIAGDPLGENLFQVSTMVEKPKPEDAPSNLAVIGRYIMTPDIFDVIRNTKPGKNNEVQITDALSTLAEKKRVLAYKFRGRRFDCGSIDGFVDATNYIYEHVYKNYNCC